MRPVFIAIQDNAYWIRLDRIDTIEPCYDAETGELTELTVCLDGECYTVDDPADIQKITDRIEVI